MNAEKLLGRGWLQLCADIDWIGYGGKWCRKVAGRRYQVVEFLNFQHAGCWEAGQDRYNVELSEIDLDRYSQKHIDRALDCTGPGRANDMIGEPGYDLVLVESCHGYGSRAPLWQMSGNNAHRLMRAAGKEARTLATDSLAYADAFHGRAVNRMGQNAESYAGYDSDAEVK